MHQACRILILFIVLFLVLIDLGRTAKTAKTSTARTTVKERVTGPLLENQIATTTVAIIPLTTIAKRQGIYPPRGNQITPGDTTTTSTTTTEKQMFDSSDRNQSIPSDVTIPSTSINSPLSLSQTTATKVTASSTTVGGLPDSSLTPTTTESVPDVTIVDCNINNFEYTSYRNSINVSWDDCGRNYNLDLSKTIYDGPEIPYIRWVNDSSSYHFINLEDCTTYNVSIKPHFGIPFEATIRTLPEEPQDLTSIIRHGKITFNWSEPISEDCKRYSVILNDEIQPQLHENAFSTLYNQSRCTRFKVALVDGENNTGGYVERMVPGEVQSLTATPQLNSIMVTWEAPVDNNCKVGYTVVLNEQVNITGTEYTFSGLEACTSYTASVAVFSDTAYGKSSTVSATTTTPTPISAVRNLNMQVLEDLLRVTWDPPNLQGACVTRYGIVMWNQDQTTIEESTTETFFEFTPLIGCMTYTVMIKPIRGVNDGVPNTKETKIPAKVNTPPTLASPVSIDKTSATITLSLQEYKANMCNIFRIIVNCTLEGSESIEISKMQDHTDSSTRTATVIMENLLPYTNYICYAYVENPAGISNASDAIEFRTSEDLPSAPRALNVVEDEEGLLITWKEPEEIPGVLGSYSITITPNESLHDIPLDCEYDATTFKTETSGLEYRYRNILANFLYRISVAASTGAGIGPETAKTVETNPQAPEIPRDVSRELVNDKSDTMLVITWKLPCKINGNLKHFEWILIGQHLENGNEVENNGTVQPTGDHSYEISINVLQYHNYTFRLAAYVQKGTDAIKGEDYVDTFVTGDGIPSAPQELVVMQDEEGLLIIWKEPEEVFGILGNYSVGITPIGPQHNISEDCDLPTEQWNDLTLALEYRYTNIFANYDYNISVAASTRAGFGPEKSTTIVTDPEVPEKPRNVNLTVLETIDSTSGIKAFIDWSEPCKINGELRYFEWALEGRHLDNGKMDNRTEIVNPSEDHNYRETITNLLPYHEYTLRLAAYVANDSNEIKGDEYVGTFKTVDGYPDAPTQLRVENVTSTGFNILWDEPFEKNGEILSYKIIIDTAGPNHVIPTGCPFPEYEASNNYSTTSKDFSLQFANGKPNFNYTITLVAETSAGFGKENVIDVVTKSAEPEAVRDVQITINNTLGEIYDARLIATWLQPCNSNGKLKYFRWILDGYSLDGETDNDTRSEQVDLLDDEESFETIVEDLKPVFIYNLSLAACIEDSDEICGEIITENFETPDGYASPPTNVTVRNVTAYSGILEWGEPSAKNGKIQSYFLEIISNGPSYYVPEGCRIVEAPSYAKNVSSTTFEFPFEGLPSYNYLANVAAMTRAGTGYEGNVNFTLNSSPSQPPREMRYSIQNYKSENYNASLTLTWVLPCNTYGKLRSFLWYMVGTSEDANSYNFSGLIAAKEEPEIDYKLVIDNLLPLHVYEFKIVAVVGDENYTIGEEFNKTFETPDGYPSKPFNLRASNLTSELALIVWDEPQNKNGRLQNYRVVITSTGPVYSLPLFCSIDYEPLLHNVTIDPEIRSFAIHGRPNFHYNIVVDATTRTDYGTKAVLNIITLAAAPQSIENLKMNITDNKSESYASYVEISFDKPCTLNAMFSHYSVSIVGKRTGFDDHAHLFSIDDFGNTSFPFNLQPEYNYAGSISVVTLFHNSTLAIPDFLSPAGVPPPTTSVPGIYRFTPNTASIILSNEMFDRTFGDIMYYAIIINVGMDNAEELGGGFQFLSAASVWPNSSYYGHEEYQATPAFWNPFKKRTTNYTYTIGNENCSANLTSYCNGPLKPQTNYGVRVRGFTSSGYRDTEVAYFTTPAEETYLALILGLIFGILAAIILLIFIFILWRRKRKEKEDNPGEDAVIEISKPPPISKNRFIDHCLMFEEDRSLLKAEYSHLDRLSATEKPSINVAMSDNNKRKNRYINIMPYDETRVKLSMDSNENYEDYINASYIRGYSKNPEYIATQGPMESTLEDFWRMIIQENVGVIVMVAQFVEQSKQKCFKYFPEKEEIMSVGRDINVKCTNEINLNDYINRTLLVERGSEQMTIKHLQYMLWPDFGCPTDTTSMLEFREVVRKHIEMSKSKAVIHCSAGVGRTGTLIAIDILLQKIDNSDDDINVFGTVLDLRKQRTHMVQTEKQYEYIHKCLREYLTKPKKTNEGYNNLGPIYENVNIINGYTNIIRNSGPHTSTENLIRLKEL